MATSAHRRAVDEARTAARRQSDPAWRLLGIEVDPGLTQADALAKLAPYLDEWAPAEVIGKGGRARAVPLPKVALQATREYFAAREIDFDSAPPKTPLLGSLRDSTQPLTYSSPYETFTRFVRRTVERCSLEPDQQRSAMKASLHWLRHTHATRFAERGGDLDVLQANLGHSDPRTSARYYRTQIERRQAQVEKVFGDF